MVADDPFAQRIVTALGPTLGPIVQYASRTPFFSNIITAIASSNDPVVRPLAYLPASCVRSPEVIGSVQAVPCSTVRPLCVDMVTGPA